MSACPCLNTKATKCRELGHNSDVWQRAGQSNTGQWDMDPQRWEGRPAPPINSAGAALQRTNLVRSMPPQDSDTLMMDLRGFLTRMLGRAGILRQEQQAWRKHAEVGQWKMPILD